MKYRCEHCNKEYSSYQSLWNHTKKFHLQKPLDDTIKSLIVTSNVTNMSLNVTNISQNKKSLTCRFCNKIFKHRQNKSLHEKTCKSNDNKIKELIENNKNKEYLLKIKKQEAKIMQYKYLIQKNNIVDTPSVNKLNKMMTVRKNLIKNSTVNSNNNIQNNIVNINFQIVGFGKEDICGLLTSQEKKQIINAKYGCLEKLVEITHCGKYNQFKNILVTNMKDNYMYKYDDKTEQFVLTSKKEAMDTLIDNRIVDLENIYDDVIETNNINNRTKEIIEDVIEKINNTDLPYKNENLNKTFNNYKEYKTDEIKILLFNNRNKNIEDITMLLTAEEILNE